MSLVCMYLCVYMSTCMYVSIICLSIQLYLFVLGFFVVVDDVVTKRLSFFLGNNSSSLKNCIFFYLEMWFSEKTFLRDPWVVAFMVKHLCDWWLLCRSSALAHQARSAHSACQAVLCSCYQLGSHVCQGRARHGVARGVWASQCGIRLLCTVRHTTCCSMAGSLRCWHSCQLPMRLWQDRVHHKQLP